MTPPSSHSAQRPSPIDPGDYNPRYARFFGWYVRRLFSRKFHAVRVVSGTETAITAHAVEPTPILVVLNHSSWWDPLVCMLVHRALCPEREACAPMQSDQLAKFGIFKKLGLFGIDPDDARSLPQLTRYVGERFKADPRPTLWITPQGRFMDVRDPIRLRPGAAAVASRAERLHVVSLAIEYAFWLDQKPEVFLRLATVSPPESSTSTGAWNETMEAAMTSNAHELSGAVRSRDAALFTTLIDSAASVNPIMDAWLRLRGKRVALTDRTREATPTPTQTGGAAT